MRLAFEQVSFSYDAPAHAGRQRAGEMPRFALRGINFAIESGEFLGVAGHTGSGKSTLIQHANGLLHPTEGRVALDGVDLAAKAAAREARRRIGLVLQYPENQLFAATVAEDVAFGPRNLGLSEPDVRARVDEALRAVGLDPEAIGSANPFALSGGQRRRAALAGVLAMRPELLVLDEPAAGLDPQGRDEILELVASLRDRGTAVIMVSHSMDDLARLADRILVLDGGRQLMLGRPADVFSHADELRAVGLDVPAAQRVAARLRAAGMPLPQKLYDVESLADAVAEQLRAESFGAPAGRS